MDGAMGPGIGKTRRMFKTEDEDEYGYMRGTWSGLRVVSMRKLWAKSVAAEQGRVLFKEYETWEDQKTVAAVSTASYPPYRGIHTSYQAPG